MKDRERIITVISGDELISFDGNGVFICDKSSVSGSLERLEDDLCQAIVAGELPHPDEEPITINVL